MTRDLHELIHPKSLVQEVASRLFLRREFANQLEENYHQAFAEARATVEPLLGAPVGRGLNLDKLKIIAEELEIFNQQLEPESQSQIKIQLNDRAREISFKKNDGSSVSILLDVHGRVIERKEVDPAFGNTSIKCNYAREPGSDSSLIVAKLTRQILTGPDKGTVHIQTLGYLYQKDQEGVATGEPEKSRLIVQVTTFLPDNDPGRKYLEPDKVEYFILNQPGEYDRLSNPLSPNTHFSPLKIIQRTE